ncbi:LURP-one-related/scramblase family protein [Agathobacter sp.]
MKLLIKQRVFSWTDTYDVYDENGNPKYLVKNEMFSLVHRIHVTNMNGREIGRIIQNFTLFVPKFDVEIGGRPFGTIEKKFTLFYPKYELNYNGWRCEGDFLAWDYDVYSGCSAVVHISKELFHWGDTYVIDIADPKDEIMALMLAIAIDAANCSNN